MSIVSPVLSISPPVLAHRGASRYAPENTRAAFLKAKQLGIHWLEFDVMLSADNKVVVIHDETVNRTTNGAGYVHEHSYDDLSQLDAGSWFSPDFEGENISLLSNVIELMSEYGLSANIEIKPFPGKEAITAKKVLEVINQYWKKEMLPPLISSFSLETLYVVRNYDKHCWLGLLIDQWIPGWKRICEELQCVSVHPDYQIMDAAKIADIKSTNRLVLCYTVNDIEKARELYSLGVDAVYSDCPDKILDGIRLK